MMDYYSAVKNNEIMKFADKLIEPENIILRGNPKSER